MSDIVEVLEFASSRPSEEVAANLRHIEENRKMPYIAEALEGQPLKDRIEDQKPMNALWLLDYKATKADKYIRLYELMEKKGFGGER